MSIATFPTNVRRTIQYLAPLFILIMAAVLPAAAQAERGRPSGRVGAANGVATSSPGAPAPARLPGSDAETERVTTAAETWQWMFGSWTEQKGLNCSIIGQHYIETMTMGAVGYEGTTPESVPFHPFVGDIYYGSIYVGVTGNPCGLGFDNIATRAILPPNTVLAIDAEHPVRCWGIPASGGNWQELTNASWQNPATGSTGPYCKTTPTAFGDGTWDFGFRPIGRGQQFQVLFPMRSLAPLKGMAGPNGGDRMGAVVTSAVSQNFTEYPSPAVPKQWVTVIANPNPPAVSYPTPSSDLVTETTARTKARLDNHYTAGNVFFDFGTTTAYGLSTQPLAIDGSADFYPQIQADWSALQPGTTYHWRLRFVAADGRTFAGTDQTFTTAGQATPPAITIGNARKTEGHTGTSNATFVLTLSRASNQDVRVTYTTADRGATAGQDYTATTNTAVIPAGTTTARITVPVMGDTLDEANELFVVDLSNPLNATIADGQGTATIVDDDAAPTITIGDVTVRETDSAGVYATFTVQLSAASGRTVKVTATTANGTALAGKDYTGRTATITFLPGATTRQFKVAITGDNLREANETFLANLTAPVYATIADGQATATIANDD